jgi:hypothetical protein
VTDAHSWRDREMFEKADDLVKRAAVDRLIGDLGVKVLNNDAAFMAGFEYGVVATENGLGRAEA